MKAIIIDGQVIAFAETAELIGNQVDTDAMSYAGFDPAQAQIIDADPPADFAPGLYTYVSGAFVRGQDAPEVMSAARAVAKADLAAIRYTHETGGVAVNGATIATDEVSQAKISGAYSYSQRNPSSLIDWKTVGGWVQISASLVATIADAVGAHVQGCFSRERMLSVQIDAALDIPSLNAIDLNEGWPA